MNTNVDEVESQDLLKIGKFWESTSVLDIKNTSGKIQYVESENMIISQVDESLNILNMSDFKLVKEIKQVNY